MDLKKFQIPKFKFSRRIFFQAIAAIFTLVFLYSFVSKHVSCIGGLPVY